MTHFVRNPRTGIADYSFDEPATDWLSETSRLLRKNQLEWGQAGVENRIAALQAWKEAVAKHRLTLIEALTTDTGRYWETVLEVDLVANSIDRWCALAQQALSPQLPYVSSIPYISLQQQWLPIPLVGVISPWNFPLLLSLIDTIPALLAGCAVMVKPSEVTPRFVEVMQQTIREVPALASVLTYLQGGGQTGAAMVPYSDLICFTGSTATGRKVYAAAAAHMIPVFLELGGKDPAIVMADADLEQAARAILWGSCVNAGHSCLSIERVFVHQSIYEQFLRILCDKAASVTLAIDHPQSGMLGPIIFDKQVHIIDAHLAEARSQGAVLHTGSWQCLQYGGGYYLPPTIITGVNPHMKIMQEETFGPVIPIMTFATNEEAIALANSTIYGLSGAVFAGTQEAAMDVARHMDGGAISINDAALTAIMHEGEKTSFKMSGIGGTRMGPSAIRRFMKQKVYLQKDNQVPSPWWW